MAVATQVSEQVRAWIARDPDPDTRAELEGLLSSGDGAALDDRFGVRLAFGTAGLRGLFGGGPNRINRLVVRQTSAGLAAYLLDHVREAGRRGVIVGYDGRHKSKVFAQDVAEVLAGYGIVTHVFDREAPTPVTAFAVKMHDAAAGVMITASHNPPDYNGYKVYWENGAQIIPPIDEGIAMAITDAAKSEVLYRDFAAAKKDGIIRSLGNETFEAYLKGVAALSVHASRAGRESVAIAYTPLHGVGAETCEEALRRAGFTNVRTVVSQREPDGDFPTVKFPNPEEPGAMDAVMALGTEMKADVVLANDPDADRLAVALPIAGGGFRMLTGDQVGVLLADDLMTRAPKDAVVANSLVSSRMLAVVAKARGVDFFETLTGFKWIANGAITRRARGQNFVFGYEEALGYTIGELVRDKDGISAVVAFAEMVTTLKAQGKTAWDRLAELYRAHGLFLTVQKSLALKPGVAIGDKLRAAPPKTVAGHAVVMTEDYHSGLRTGRDGGQTDIGMPKSDVLVYHLANDARVIVRPSGTEPKLKCYYEVREPLTPGEDVAVGEARARKALEQLVKEHGASLPQ